MVLLSAGRHNLGDSMELVVEQPDLGAYGTNVTQYEISTASGKFLGYIVKYNDRPDYEFNVGANPDLHLSTDELRAVADKMDELNTEKSFWRQQLSKILGR